MQNIINPEQLINDKSFHVRKVKDPDALIISQGKEKGYYRLVFMNGADKGFYALTNRKVF